MLDVAMLERGLADVFYAKPGSSSEAEERWARAYHEYAVNAEDVSGDPLATQGDEAAFRAQLVFVSSKSASDAARMFDAALAAYWGAAVTFETNVLIVSPPGGCPNIGGNGTWGLETSSVVVGVTMGELERRLEEIFQTTGTAEEQVKKIAKAFHEATTVAVRVLINGFDTTLPMPLPIANVCAVR